MKKSKDSPYPFRRIATALAFSPRAEALLHETRRLVERFDAELLLVHVGEKSPYREENLEELLQCTGLQNDRCRVLWRQGRPDKAILRTCEEEDVDLLILGALRKEKLFAYYLGSVARRISRNATFSVLLLTEPSEEGQYFDKLVVNGLDHPKTRATVHTAFYFARCLASREVRIVEEVPPSEVQVAIEDDESRKEAVKVRESLRVREHQRVERLIGEAAPDDSFEVEQQCIFGKPGYTIGHYAEAEKADLLVINSPDKRFGILDRFFPHDIEYILSDMPTNVLIVHSGAKGGEHEEDGSGS
jgi:nucleotide-binding universal stress UspA family protein